MNSIYVNVILNNVVLHTLQANLSEIYKGELYILKEGKNIPDNANIILEDITGKKYKRIVRPYHSKAYYFK